MRIVFDIDGTLCEFTTDYSKYHESKPFKPMVELINDMYNRGHYIIVQTARGMGSCGGIVAKAYNKWYSKTEAQLESWGLKYHELHLGKPHGDVYVDDKAFRMNPDGSSVGDLKRFLEEMECD
ncbi:hypothetical protein LCGC14_1579950 [marine sediment metagenome]|uniref:Polynucleotide kinase PNKP phosphatase domain-containing protein n=1 Tax=marine sediment metagenome TaxID=412755 RepID=A0A0F9IHB6_9ZZZZ